MLVLVVVGGAAWLIGAGGQDTEASCEVYSDVVLNSEVWAATEFDADKPQQVYDTALGDITDDEIASLVREESEVVVGYYREVDQWKKDMDDALARGEYPEDIAIPEETLAKKDDISRAQGAVLEVCGDALDWERPSDPPTVTAPPLLERNGTETQ